MVKRVGIFVVFAAVLLVACGGSAGTAGSATGSPAASAPPSGGSRAPAPGGVDVCDLVDQAAVDAFFGARTGVHFQSSTACRFGAGAIDLSVSVASPKTRSDYDAERAKRTDTVDVAGIGEVADYWPKLSTLTFLTGDTIIAIGVIGGNFDPAAVRAFVEAQARHADSVR